MFKKILVPVDGSDNSMMAAMIALDLATKNGGGITLLYVVRSYLFQFGVEGSKTPEMALTEYAEDMGREILKRIAEKIGAPDSELLIEKGNPADVICSQADDGDFDLIVMGSRGMTGLTGTFIGSVSQKVVHMAECPVLLTRLPKHTKEEYEIIKSLPSAYI